MSRELTITRLGSKGDGIAETAGGPVYTPFTLPGETVKAELDGARGRLVEICASSPERIQPVCQHFGICGGCSLQHLNRKAYLAWKREQIIEALRLEKIDAGAIVEPVASFGPHSRRRASFTVLRKGKDLHLGFRRAFSHELVDLQECPVLTLEIETALPGLRKLLNRILPDGEARLHVTSCVNGLDIGIETKGKGRVRLKAGTGQSAQELGIIRLTINDDPLLHLDTPLIRCAGVDIELPAGAFLQASGDAEAAMAEFAVKHLAKSKKIADLFCGLGAFSFALSKRAAVTAVDNNRALMAALEQASRHAKGIKPIASMTRDLMRDPLSYMELNRFDAVLFDPPRAGAQAQARSLAKSRIARIVAISCNPATFARDACILIDGGYVLESIRPIDQFVFSAHIELAAAFTRKK